MGRGEGQEEGGERRGAGDEPELALPNSEFLVPDSPSSSPALLPTFRRALPILASRLLPLLPTPTYVFLDRTAPTGAHRHTTTAPLFRESERDYVPHRFGNRFHWWTGRELL